MSFSLPSFDCVATSLASSLPKEGLSKLSFPTKNTNLDHERYYLWNTLDASWVHDIPFGYDVVSLRELVSLRIDHCMSMLELSHGPHLADIQPEQLIHCIREKAHKIIPLISPLWQRRLKTSTAMYRTQQWDIEYIDIATHTFQRHPDTFTSLDGTYAFRQVPNFFIDYRDVSDGGIKVVWSIEGSVYGRLSWDDYCTAQWGNKTLFELASHPVLQTVIPDDTLRRQYLTCLWIFDILGFYDLGTQSLWSPREIKEWYLRWFDLWFKADAVYPPNCTTTHHSVLLRIQYL